MAAKKMAQGEGFVLTDSRNKGNRTVRVTREGEDVRITVVTNSKTAGAIVTLRDLLKAVGES